MTDSTGSGASGERRWHTLGFAAAGGLLGGLVGATFAVLVTEVIKRTLAVVTRQDTWVLIVVPLIGISLAVIVLHVIGCGAGVQTLEPAEGDQAEVPGGAGGPRHRPARRRRTPGPWRSFPDDVARADLTADVVACAGGEERFPWRLAPVRAVAILATVGLGAPMGTEAPAAHLGVAAGAFLGDRGDRWRRLARPAALGGGAAGVAALMGIPLVGLAFMLELGRRRSIGITAERVVAALAGALVGWGINVAFDLDLIRLVVPRIAPGDLLHALGTAILVGAIAGGLTSLTGAAIYRARGWKASPAGRLVIGGAAVAATAIAIAIIATPTAGIGPGGGAVVWAEVAEPAAMTLFAVALLRAAATTAAVAAGGCGGVFVPFLAIGDLAGRAFAPALGVSGDLAGAAGAAGGIAGGYRLPWTAAAMVVGIGGPPSATLTCLATVGVAAIAGVGAGQLLDRTTRLKLAATARKT